MSAKRKAGDGRNSAQVVHGSEHVNFTFDGAGSFEVTDFHSWVRSRFGLPSDVPVCYLCDGREVVPSCSVLKAGVPVHIISLDQHNSHAKPPLTQKAWPLHYNAYLLLLVGLNALAFAPRSSFTEFVSLVADWTLWRAAPLWKKVLTDAYVAGLCWGTTYLFVRRMGNPENLPLHTALGKFAPDAIFGGLSAGCAVVMRHLILTHNQ